MGIDGSRAKLRNSSFYSHKYLWYCGSHAPWSSDRSSDSCISFKGSAEENSFYSISGSPASGGDPVSCIWPRGNDSVGSGYCSHLSPVIRRDAITARDVIHSDDEVDRLFDDVKSRLIEGIKTIEDSGSQGAKILDILMISKYMERIGDHAVNIAGWVCYSVTGTREVS